MRCAQALVFLVIAFENLHRVPCSHRQNQNRGGGVEGIHGHPGRAHDAQAPDNGKNGCQQRQAQALPGPESFQMNQTNQHQCHWKQNCHARRKTFYIGEKHGSATGDNFDLVGLGFVEYRLNLVYHVSEALGADVNRERDRRQRAVFGDQRVLVDRVAFQMTAQLGDAFAVNGQPQKGFHFHL